MAHLPTQAGEAPVVLVFGDSLSAAYGIDPAAGWTALLQRRLRERGHPHQVANASISGDTTAGGLTRLPAALERYRPAILILELGANDGLRGLSLEQAKRNLARMIDLGRQAGARVLLLGMRMPPNLGPLYTGKFRAMYLDLAQEKGVPLVPFLLEGVARDPQLMQADGLHPNAAAQPRLLENVWPALEPLLTAAEGGEES